MSPFQDIETFAELRRQRGVNVSAVRFDDSPHVKHFSFHREIYINTVCSFLHLCLSGMFYYLHNNNQAIQLSLSYFLSTLKCFCKLLADLSNVFIKVNIVNYYILIN